MKLVSLFKRAAQVATATTVVLTSLVALPLHSMAAYSVQLEGAIGVANVSKGDTKYVPSVNASYDQVVEVEVYYHNREDPNSGKIAQNLRMKIDMPTTVGKTQVIKETTKADNSANTVTGQATVNLDRTDATLDYVPGSAEWKHNVGTNDNIQYRTDKISDAVVTSSQGLVLENEKPCYNFSATVTVLARVHVPSVGITKKVRKSGTTDTTVTDLNGVPGETLDYVVTIKNLGNENLSNVYIRDALPKGVTFVPGSVKQFYGTLSGAPMTANEEKSFFSGRVNVGTLTPGAQANIVFQAVVANQDALTCGTNTLKNIAVVDTDQTGEYNNSATVTVNKVCQEVKGVTTPTVTPQASLPKTGAGNIAGIFGATSVAGAIAYRLFIGRRLARCSL
jgi:uncharacterized repeat protein (TIGR01451 family)